MAWFWAAEPLNSSVNSKQEATQPLQNETWIPTAPTTGCLSSIKMGRWDFPEYPCTLAGCVATRDPDLCLPPTRFGQKDLSPWSIQKRERNTRQHSYMPNISNYVYQFIYIKKLLVWCILSWNMFETCSYEKSAVFFHISSWQNHRQASWCSVGKWSSFLPSSFNKLSWYQTTQPKTSCKSITISKVLSF